MSKVKGGLGKGLAALIRPAEVEKPALEAANQIIQTVTRETEGVAFIELRKIKPNPFQPRADFDEVALDELKKSILEKGIIQPVTVRRKDGGYELIAGERRVRASLDAGLIEIPAYIIDVKTDEEMLELALIENLQREYLNPIEIAISYQRLVTECNQTYEEVARRIGKDRTTVINFLRLLKLPQPVQQSLRKSELTAGHARALLSLPDEKQQMKVFQKILKTGLNVRQVEKLVKNFSKKPDTGKLKLQTNTLTEFSDLEEKLRQVFGTKVKMYSKGEGKGEVVIEYYSILDLERLIELFMIIKSHS